MRILLAEDEKDLVNALCTILKHSNYSVDAVYNGANDYLTKPFAAKELLARIRAVTRNAAANEVFNKYLPFLWNIVIVTFFITNVKFWDILLPLE